MSFSFLLAISAGYGYIPPMHSRVAVIERLKAAYLAEALERLGLAEKPRTQGGLAVAETAAEYESQPAVLRRLLHRVVDAALDQVEPNRACLAEESGAWLESGLIQALGREPAEVAAFVRAEVPRLIKLRRLVRLMDAPDPLSVPETAGLAQEGPPPLLSAETGAFRDLLDQVTLIADNAFSVLITGESGTGKELIARRIHQLSPVADGPFLPVDCAALPESLVEAELFGHEKGAFTGALRARPGKIEIAAGGTLFLDEVAELPLSSQVKLLRFLQERVVERLGGGRPRQVQVRVVAATSRDLEERMAERGFREDLYYRLATLPLKIPPLRERPEDVPVLIDHYLPQACLATRKPRHFSERVLGLLADYDYPGNVRELTNFINHAVTVSERHLIDVADLPQAVAVKLLGGSPEPVASWLGVLDGLELGGGDGPALAGLLAHNQSGYLANADLRRVLHCSDTKAKTILNRLAGAGAVAAEGERGGRRYRIIERVKEERE